MLIRAFGDTRPMISLTAFVAENASVIGNVQIGDHGSIWYGAVLRGDLEAISLGARSNLQDNAVVHADPGSPASIGEDVSIGHGAVLHGCTIEDGCLIGMNATVLNGAIIGAGSLVAAGALVLERTVVPPNSLVAGVPAKVRRELTSAESSAIEHNARVYVQLASSYGAVNAQSSARD